MSNRKSLTAITLIIVSAALINLSWSNDPKTKRTAVKEAGDWYKKEMLQFDSLLQQYPSYFYSGSYGERRAKFDELVIQFKKVEGLFTYLHPKLVYETFLVPAGFQKRDFGIPVPDNWIFLGPFGLEPDSTLQKFRSQDSLMFIKIINRSVTNFRNALATINTTNDVNNLTEADIFEAMRLQLMRISSIGIANGDFAVDEAAKPGLQGAFEGWTVLMKMLIKDLPASMKAYKENVDEKLTAGQKIIVATNDMKAFDRLSFLTAYLIPLAGNLNDLKRTFKVENKSDVAAIRNNVKHLYEQDVFDADFFAPGNEAYNSKAKAALGEFLFFDPLLSDNNERACASCHKPELAFTDGFTKSLSFVKGDLPRNAPTVINSAFQTRQFWDLRATTLEDQLDSVVNNVDEMHSSFDDVVQKINTSKEYKEMFYAAFPQARKTGIERKHVKIAIASYERELTGLNSRFDQYIRGNETKMSQAEKNGFNLFMGKARCGSCHYAPLFNSSLPPYFTITDHKSIGVPVKDTMEIHQVDADTGASKPFKEPLFHFSFKTPTVRNAAITAPYMHNGVFKSLAQVVDFYNDGAGTNFTKQMRPGMKGLPFFMILPEKLQLTTTEKKELVLFMEALTDTTASRRVPTYLPALSGKYAGLNKRRIGGLF